MSYQDGSVQSVVGFCQVFRQSDINHMTLSWPRLRKLIVSIDTTQSRSIIAKLPFVSKSKHLYLFSLSCLELRTIFRRSCARERIRVSLPHSRESRTRHPSNKASVSLNTFSCNVERTLTAVVRLRNSSTTHITAYLNLQIGT